MSKIVKLYVITSEERPDHETALLSQSEASTIQFNVSFLRSGIFLWLINYHNVKALRALVSLSCPKWPHGNLTHASSAQGAI